MSDFFNYTLKNYPAKSAILFETNSKESYTLTVAIPTFNRPQLLKNSLSSLLEAVRELENSERIEIIIVDNHSFEPSLDIVEKISNQIPTCATIRYFYNKENIGMFGNWNRCLELAQGEWISILNDDDLFSKNIIIDFFSELPKTKNLVIFQHKLLIEHRTKPISKMFDFLRVFKLFSRTQINFKSYYWEMPNMGSLGAFFKREKALSINGFPEQFFPINDWVFFSKYVYHFGDGLKINKVSTSYRVGVNESMKQEVAIKSIELSYSYRNYINSFLHYKFHSLINRLYVLARMNANKRVFNLSNYSINLLEEYNIKKSDLFIFPVFRLLLFIKRLLS